jgi:aspartate racemase
MKTIGIIGGLSSASSAHYYQALNKTMNERLGGNHNAKSIMYTFDLEDFEPAITQEKWGEVAENLINASRSLEAAGVDFIIIACNTVHKVAPLVEPRLKVPLIHIVDPTGAKIRAMGLKKVGLLGTRWTMEDGYYSDRLRDKFGVEAAVPELDDRVTIHSIILELVNNRILEPSHEKLVSILGRVEKMGVEGVILGCTELPLILSQRDTSLPLFDGDLNHIVAAIDYALA